MKILGISGTPYNKSFIVEINEEEMRSLIGCKSTERIGSGDIVKVVSSIHRLEQIDNQPKQRATIATQLRAMAEIIELIPAIVIPAETLMEGGEA